MMQISLDNELELFLRLHVLAVTAVLSVAMSISRVRCLRKVAEKLWGTPTGLWGW